MSGDFTPEQKRYLEGFTSGLQIARAGRGNRHARGGRAVRSRRRASARAGPDGRARRQAQRPGEVQARAASVRRLWPAEGAGGEERAARSPPTISAGAITACSTSRRRRAPTCAGCASRTASSRTGSSRASPISPSSYGGGYSHVTTRANLQIREIEPKNAVAMLEGDRGPRPLLARLRRRQHPQRHRHADRRHRPAGADRHAALCARLALPHPQRARALRPAAQVQRRLRRRRHHPGAGGHQRHRLPGGRGEGRLRRRARRLVPAVLGGITGHRISRATPA